MKTKQFVSLVMVVSGTLVVPHAIAQQNTDQPRVVQPRQDPSQLGQPQVGQPPADQYQVNQRAPAQADRERLGVLSRSSELIGLEITDSTGKELGKIHDLAVDLQSGRVLQVIVSSGGIFGFGARHVGVPASLLTMDGTGEGVGSRIDREKFLTAPAFTYDQWSLATGPDQVNSVYRHFAVEPRFQQDQREGLPQQAPFHSRPVDASATPWGVERATKLVGMNVVNAADENVGEVEDLVLDLAAGRVNTVLVASGGFLGVGEELSALPPTVFRYDPNEETLSLQASNDALRTGPRYRSEDWSRYSNEEGVRSIYQAYGIQPYFDADNTRINVRDRDNRTVTPFDQGSSDTDVQMTAEIRRAIVNAEGLTITAQNVKIITQGGHVILRGPVTSLGEKKLIEEIARVRAGTNNVESQLEIRADDSDNRE